MEVKISETGKGIIFLILSAFCFALMAVFVRLAGDIHFIQKAFFRNVVAFLLAAVSLGMDWRRYGRTAVSIPKGAFLFLLIRATAGSLGVFGNYYAIDRLVLSDAAILNKMSPFFAVVFSFLLLREKIRPVPLVAITVAFLGAMLVVKPSFDFSQTLPSLAGFAGGVGAGLAYACVRKLGLMKCNGKIIILFFSAFSMLLSVPYMLLHFNPMTLEQTLLLCAAGASAAGGQFAITAAYYHAPAGRISIYDYSQILFSTLLGLVFFGQLPDLLSFIGYLIIIAMALLNFIYNRRLVDGRGTNGVRIHNRGSKTKREP